MGRRLTTEEKLQRTTRLFGKAYARANRADALKKKYQSKYFDLFTERLSKRQLATKLINVPEGIANEDVEAWVAKCYPGWLFVQAHTGRVQIQQDPAYVKDEFVNQTDGMVYGRTIAASAPVLDLERLKATDPQFYQSVTKPVTIRELRSDLNDKETMKLAKYYTPGKLTIKLVPPRPAKPEELP